MNGYDDITPQLRSWLKEPISLREDGLSEVARAVHETPQQHGSLPTLSPTWLGGAWSTTGVVMASLFVALASGMLFLGIIARPSVVEMPAAAPPEWPGVEFEPVESACADGCGWDTGGVWRVGTAHHGDFGSTQAIALGPTGAPWFLSDDSVWRLGVPGGSFVSPLSASHDIAVTSDGVVWVASDLGLYSYDGRDWTAHWTEMPLADLDVAADGTVYAVGGGRGQNAVTVVATDGVGVTSSSVDVIDRDRYPTSIAVDLDDRIWVSAIGSGFVPPAVGESLIAFTDGSGWHTARPLGADTDVASFSLVRAPDGSVWSLLWAHSPEEGAWRSLARIDGQGWTTHSVEGDFVGVAAIGPDGAAWFPGDTGVSVFDGSSWERFLGDLRFGNLALLSDGTVLATTVPGFDEEGELFAIRRAP